MVETAVTPRGTDSLLRELQGYGGILAGADGVKGKHFGLSLLDRFSSILLERYGLLLGEGGQARAHEVLAAQLLKASSGAEMAHELVILPQHLTALNRTPAKVVKLLEGIVEAADQSETSLEAAKEMTRGLGELHGVCTSIITFGQSSRETEVRQLLVSETDRVEFKETMRWDIRQARRNPEMDKEVAQALAGFMNYEGGDLFIGVADDGTLRGLDPDFAAFTRSLNKRDAFKRAFGEIVAVHLGGPNVYSLLVTQADFVEIDGILIFNATVRKSREPVFVADGHAADLYVRVGNSTPKFNTRSAIAYYTSRWLPPQ